MKIMRQMISILLAALLAMPTALFLTSCSKDERGRKYSSKKEDIAAATELVGSTKAASDLIEDIEYDIALMVHTKIGETNYDLGLKNSFSAFNRGTEESEVYCSKIYYGTESNNIAVYYRYDGHLYMEYCNTLIRSPMSEKDFYEKLNGTALTASTDYFKPSNFEKGTFYKYSDGTRSAVFTKPVAEVGESIAAFLGFKAEGSYVYEVKDIMLIYDVKADGTLKECVLDFNVEYYNTLSEKEKVYYDGEFVCRVNKAGEGVAVKRPPEGVEYSTISSFDNMKLLTSGYQTLAKMTDVKAQYYRKVTNEDNTGNLYEIENTATFTQTYRNEKYLYGSIDVEKGKIIKVPKEGEPTITETETSVGVFVDSEGKRHYRDLEGKNDKTEDNTLSVDEMKNTFAYTITEELFFEEDLCKLTVAEQDGMLIFTYEYYDDVLDDYATYLLNMFAAEQGSLSIDGMPVRASRNKGTVKIRLSDGCLVYHKVEFEALIGYTISVSGDFTLDITETGEDVEVLELYDWEMHKNKFN